METAGYIASVLIGITLGLIGGGGSILTVPVLVYLFETEVVSATAYSLFIVGITSVVGSVSYFKKGQVNLKTAAIFGIPSIAAVYLTRAFIIPAIPETVLETGSFTLSKNLLLLLLFSVLMIFSAFGMIRKKRKVPRKRQEKKLNYFLIFLEGSIVGVLTGLVGAGGGFLIIPALVILGNLPMKEAVGTSLAIIAAKSLIGFLGENHQTAVDWWLLLKISGFSIAGIFIGTLLSGKIDEEKLKPAFGYFVLFMGIFILIKEIF